MHRSRALRAPNLTFNTQAELIAVASSAVILTFSRHLCLAVAAVVMKVQHECHRGLAEASQGLEWICRKGVQSDEEKSRTLSARAPCRLRTK